MKLPDPSWPDDVHNRTLIDNVHPGDWVNPDPAGRYNLVVMGGGTAGLVCAAGAAGLGARVALVERGFLGGDCLNFGCVPSKTLIRSARAMADVREAARYGVATESTKVDFASIMERVREIRAKISPHDSARRFRDEYGIDIFLGEALFASHDEVEVEGKRLRFERAVITTGARAAVPSIPGLSDAGFLTNETVFNLTEQPPRLAVLGGGPVGCELAQAFARLGSEVTIIQRSSTLLPREDPDAAEALRKSFDRDGVRIRVDTRVERVERTGQATTLHLVSDRHQQTLEVDALLVATGRVPNVRGMGLEHAGIEIDENGIRVDDYLRTSNRRIFAAGDVCAQFKFTHTADAMARIVIQNAFFGLAGRKKASDLIVPWCTYTDPEIAHVRTPKWDEGGADARVFTVPLRDVDRSITEGSENGFVKIHVRAGSDEILAATIVARHAGEMISEVTTAIVAGAGLGKMASVIHPYPTEADAIRKAADLYQRTRVSAGIKEWLSRYFAWRRR